MSEFTGQCYCGAVVFTVQGPTKWCGHCHCSICQRIHGSAVVTWVGCEQDSVSIEAQDASLRWYSSTEGAERGSCIKCGSQLFFKSVRWPGELHIVRSNFPGEIDRQPAGHTHEESRVAWFTLD